MNSNEWPLVFFTLFSQASAGIMLASALMLFLLKGDGNASGAELRRTAALFALVLMGMALMISFLHLSRPHASVFAISNLGASWLSREIILAGVFFLFTALVYLMPGIAGGKWSSAMLIASGVAGMVLVYSMVRLYMIPTVPAWNNPATPLAFFSSTLLLGAMISLGVMAYLATRSGHPDFPHKLVRMIAILAVAGALLQLGNTLYVWFGQTLAEGSFPAPELPAMIRVVQVLLLAASLGVMAAWLVRGLPLQGYLAWVLVAGTGFIAAELIGRFLFYASYYRLGI
jgi:anaerobic dimethyl sulfoxide reductase subunit C